MRKLGAILTALVLTTGQAQALEALECNIKKMPIPAGTPIMILTENIDEDKVQDCGQIAGDIEMMLSRKIELYGFRVATVKNPASIILYVNFINLYANDTCSTALNLKAITYCFDATALRSYTVEYASEVYIFTSPPRRHPDYSIETLGFAASSVLGKMSGKD